MMFTATWSDERAEQLEKLWDAQLSAGEIAKIMGVTRNTICGKIHRMGLKRPFKKKTARKAKKVARPSDSALVKKPRRPVVKPEPYVVQPPAAVEPRNIDLIDLRSNDCRFPYGGDNGEPITFCGHPKAPGTSWCAAHFKIVFAPRPLRQPTRPLYRDPAPRFGGRVA